MDINLFRSVATLLLLVVFLLIVGWAYSSRNKASFDEQAQLPLEDEVSGRPQ